MLAWVHKAMDLPSNAVHLRKLKKKIPSPVTIESSIAVSHNPAQPKAEHLLPIAINYMSRKIRLLYKGWIKQL